MCCCVLCYYARVGPQTLSSRAKILARAWDAKGCERTCHWRADFGRDVDHDRLGFAFWPAALAIPPKQTLTLKQYGRHHSSHFTRNTHGVSPSDKPRSTMHCDTSDIFFQAPPPLWGFSRDLIFSLSFFWGKMKLEGDLNFEFRFFDRQIVDVRVFWKIWVLKKTMEWQI